MTRPRHRLHHRPTCCGCAPGRRPAAVSKSLDQMAAFRLGCMTWRNSCSCSSSSPAMTVAVECGHAAAGTSVQLRSRQLDGKWNLGTVEQRRHIVSSHTRFSLLGFQLFSVLSGQLGRGLRRVLPCRLLRIGGRAGCVSAPRTRQRLCTPLVCKLRHRHVGVSASSIAAFAAE